MHSKLGDNPAFVKFFNENKEFHYKYAEDIFSEIVEFVNKLTQKEEIDANDDDFLVGLILIYDRLITIKYEFSRERTIKIIDLFFLSSKLNKQKLKDFVASSCKQWIAVPKRFDFIKKVIDTQEDYH